MRIDYNLLKKISLDKKNKTKLVFDESIVLSSFLKLLSNIIYEFDRMHVNEVALFINSINHWVTNKKYINKKKYKPGTIIEYDCGLNYSGELSYRHTGLVLEELDKKILVIPSSSSEKYIKRTSEKENGLWYYKLVGKSEGFDHDCVLLVDNLKMISKQRVIGKFGNIQKEPAGKNLFNTIKVDILSHYFSKQYNELVIQNKDLCRIIDEKNIEIDELKSKIKSQREKINGFYASLRRKNSH